MDSRDMIKKVSERHWVLMKDVKQSKYLDNVKRQKYLKNLKTNFYYYLKANKCFTC